MVYCTVALGRDGLSSIIIAGPLVGPDNAIVAVVGLLSVVRRSLSIVVVITAVHYVQKKKKHPLLFSFITLTKSNQFE